MTLPTPQELRDAFLKVSAIENDIIRHYMLNLLMGIIKELPEEIVLDTVMGFEVLEFCLTIHSMGE